jgi:hypothetical protein
MSYQKWEVLYTDKNEPKILINFKTMQMKMIEDFDNSNKKRKRDTEDDLVQKNIKKDNRSEQKKKDAQTEENKSDDHNEDKDLGEDDHAEDKDLGEDDQTEDKDLGEDDHAEDKDLGEDDHAEDKDLGEDDQTEDDQTEDDQGEDDQAEDDHDENEKLNDSQTDDIIDEYIEDDHSGSSSTSKMPEQGNKHYIKNHILDAHKKDITAARNYMHIKKTNKIRGAIPKWVKKALY